MTAYSSIIIIGAPRSGTNMLRDVLTQLDGMATWPCDEINYVWRHGNARMRSDELGMHLVTSRNSSHIRASFDWVAQKYGAGSVVEKTCANSLRVPFVDAVIPDAKYIFIRRDGLDAVGSALKQWKAKLDILYVARKVRFVPLSDLPYYGGRYLWNRFYRLFSREDHLAIWGPQLDGMDELLTKHPLDEVCALQWQRCVDKTADAFAAMSQERWLEVAYEDFVREPESELARVLDFVGLNVSDERRQRAVAGIRADSVGKGRATLGELASTRIESLVNSTLVRYGYA